MRVGVLTHTTVSDGHRARAWSSVVYSPGRGTEGEPDAGADGCHHGNGEPD